MSTEFIQSSVMLTKNQKEFLKSNYINLSRLTRDRVNQLMKNREGPDLHSRPSQAPSEDLTNG